MTWAESKKAMVSIILRIFGSILSFHLFMSSSTSRRTLAGGVSRIAGVIPFARLENKKSPERSLARKSASRLSTRSTKSART